MSLGDRPLSQAIEEPGFFGGDRCTRIDATSSHSFRILGPKEIQRQAIIFEPSLVLATEAVSPSSPDKLPLKSSAPLFTNWHTKCFKEQNLEPQRRRPSAKRKPKRLHFVVSQTIGLDAGRASADYIQLYHGNAALLAESVEVPNSSISDQSLMLE